MPELELWETTDEGSEFLVLLGGEAGGPRITVLQTLILRERGVELGSQERKEQVQQVNAECVGNCERPELAICLPEVFLVL